jgi:acyl phosphate:glycerol-3-phosphate acyltransferase
MNVSDGLVSALILALCFLLGSVPFGLIVAKLFSGRDITREGSGNIGATNVSRVLGFWPWGALTFFLDMSKGALPFFLTHPEGMQVWTSALGLPTYDLGPGLAWSAGLLAVIGHCFSPWLHFNGGKGVATGFGAILFLSPWSALAGLCAFAITFLSTRIGSLSSLAGLAIASVTHLILNPLGGYLWAGAAMIFVIVARHESNIDAILDNRERSF